MRIATKSIPAEIRQVIRGDPAGFLRAGAMMAGVTLAGAGHMSGRLRLYRTRRKTAGLRCAPAPVATTRREIP